MNELIINIVNICLIPILGVLTTYACMWIKSKINALKDQNTKNFLLASLDEVNIAVNTAVNKVAQTYVESLKKDGQFNAEEQKNAFKNAYDTTLSILSNDTIDFLNSQLTSEGFEDLIKAKIEEFVLNSKKSFSVTSGITPPAKKPAK